MHKKRFPFHIYLQLSWLLASQIFFFYSNQRWIVLSIQKHFNVMVNVVTCTFFLSKNYNKAIHKTKSIPLNKNLTTAQHSWNRMVFRSLSTLSFVELSCCASDYSKENPIFDLKAKHMFTEKLCSCFMFMHLIDGIFATDWIHLFRNLMVSHMGKFMPTTENNTISSFVSFHFFDFSTLNWITKENNWYAFEHWIHSSMDRTIFVFLIGHWPLLWIVLHVALISCWNNNRFEFSYVFNVHLPLEFSCIIIKS